MRNIHLLPKMPRTGSIRLKPCILYAVVQDLCWKKGRGETYANVTSWHSNLEPFVGNFSTFDWTPREICMKDLSFEDGEYSMNVFTGPLKGK